MAELAQRGQDMPTNVRDVCGVGVVERQEVRDRAGQFPRVRRGIAGEVLAPPRRSEPVSLESANGSRRPSRLRQPRPASAPGYSSTGAASIGSNSARSSCQSLNRRYTVAKRT